MHTGPEFGHLDCNTNCKSASAQMRVEPTDDRLAQKQLAAAQLLLLAGQ